jgi:hypothetical protein
LSLVGENRDSPPPPFRGYGAACLEDRTFKSWNRLTGWLRELGALRDAD